MKKSILFWGVALGAIVLFCAGCAGFGREWRQAGGLPWPPGDIAGRWDGSWRSDVNHHEGKLRCVLTKVEEGQYRAKFHARYRKVLSFSYAVNLQGVRTNGEVHFHGEANLGKLAGGVYTYEGTATPEKFRSTYSSKYDHGVFEMSRVAENTGKN